MSEDSPADVTSLTVQLLSAYLSNNTVESGDLASLIATTRAALSAPSDAPSVTTAQTFEPAVSVRKSLASSEHIISMIDGKPYKMLKRHLLGHGLTPAEYRARYNLPADYPTVAPAYSDQRREVAKTLGLGRKAAQGSAGSPAPLTDAEAPVASAPKPAAKAKAAPKTKAAPKAKTTAKAPAEAAPELEPATLVEAVIAADTTKAPQPRKSAKAKSPAKTAEPVVAATVDGASPGDPAPAKAPTAAKKAGGKAKTGAKADSQEAPLATDMAKPAPKSAPKAKSGAAASGQTAEKPVRGKRMARSPKVNDEAPTDVVPEPTPASQ